MNCTHLKYVLLEKKYFSWIFTFWKQLEHQILGFAVFQSNTKLYAKYMNAIFGDQFYRRYILKISKNLSQL